MAVVLSEKVDTTLSKGILRVGGTVVGGSLGELCFSFPASKLCLSREEGGLPICIQLSVGFAAQSIPSRTFSIQGSAYGCLASLVTFTLPQEARCV